MLLKTKVFSDLFHNTLLDILEELSTSKALAIAIALRHFEQVSTDDLKALFHVDPNVYDSADSYFRDAQAIALLKKTEMFPKRYDSSAVLEFYESSEAIASSMSESFRRNHAFSFEDVSVLNRASQIIHGVMKECPDIENWRFGPGSTYSLRGRNSGLIPKLRHKPEVTPQAHDGVYRLINNSYLTLSYSRSFYGPPTELNFVPGDRFDVVPKDIFKPRIMAIQPTGNMLLQLAVEETLRKGFYRYSGIDIAVQPTIHHQLLDGTFGTIDLSSASDSICTEIVERLLPPKWFKFLDLCRCKHTVIKVGNKMVLKPNRKFMAQGNGFTFILETIIFYSLVRAFLETRIHSSCNVRHLVSVFGDDIIVPVHYQVEVSNFLERLGFSVNKDKSFGTNSPFKESCGVDVYTNVNGYSFNVRPIYFKEFSNTQEGLYLLANAVTRVSEWFYGKCILGGKFRRAHNRIIAHLTKYCKEVHYGFRECPEGSFIWSTTKPQCTYRGGICYIKGLRFKSQRQRFSGNPFEDLAAALYGVPAIGSTIRGQGKYTRYRLAYNHGRSTLLLV